MHDKNHLMVMTRCAIMKPLSVYFELVFQKKFEVQHLLVFYQVGDPNREPDFPVWIGSIMYR
jgi:hypothetical protein